MHPRDLGKQAYGITGEENDRGIIDPTEAPLEADKHGMVQQRHDPEAHFAASREALDKDPDLSSPLLYVSHGGGIQTPNNREHWGRQPLVHIRTDTPLHSTQSAVDTEHTGDLKGIRRDLEAGGEINNPAWVVKDNGKLFVLDGHHRIAASRMAGRHQFPARLWDRDAGAADT